MEAAIAVVGEGDVFGRELEDATLATEDESTDVHVESSTGPLVTCIFWLRFGFMIGANSCCVGPVFLASCECRAEVLSTTQ